MKRKIQQFFFPSLTAGFLLRAAILAASTYLLCQYVCIPFRIQGASMEPTYRDGGFNFCFTPVFWFSEPRRHQVVVIRLAGTQIMLLKRVVALAGEVVEFRQGRLWVNGRKIHEPYVHFAGDWELPPRRVEEGHVYVIGDNRNHPLHRHSFGQASIHRILGVPLW